MEIFSNPTVLLVIIFFIVFFLIFTIIKGVINSFKSNSENKRIKKEYEVASRSRDESFAEMQQEFKEKIKKLKSENNELKDENMRLQTNFNNLRGQKYNVIETQILEAAIEKIQQDPRISPFFATMWDNAKKEATQEIEEASLGRRILNFFSIKNIRTINNKQDDITSLEVSEEKLLPKKK